MDRIHPFAEFFLQLPLVRQQPNERLLKEHLKQMIRCICSYNIHATAEHKCSGCDLIVDKYANILNGGSKTLYKCFPRLYWLSQIVSGQERLFMIDGFISSNKKTAFTRQKMYAYYNDFKGMVFPRRYIEWFCEQEFVASKVVRSGLSPIIDLLEQLKYIKKPRSAYRSNADDIFLTEELIEVIRNYIYNVKLPSPCAHAVQLKAAPMSV